MRPLRHAAKHREKRPHATAINFNAYDAGEELLTGGRPLKGFPNVFLTLYTVANIVTIQDLPGKSLSPVSHKGNSVQLSEYGAQHKRLAIVLRNRTPTDGIRIWTLGSDVVIQEWEAPGLVGDYLIVIDEEIGLRPYDEVVFAGAGRIDPLNIAINEVIFG
jgi:hypothetical protein